AALACCGFPLGVGHLLSTAAFDLTAWMALLWLTARLLRTDDPRWWLAFGAVAGLALWNKHLVVMLAITVLVGLALARRWRLLRSPWLLAGGGLALLIVLPNLLWQADHDWPQLEMAEALSERLAGENRATLFPLQLLFGGPLLAVVLFTGARALGREEPLRPFRALLWMWPVGLAITFVTAGRPYYVMPLTVVVLIAGVVTWVGQERQRLLTGLLLVSTVVTIPLALPVLPTGAVDVTGVVNEAAVESIGWPELVDQVAAVVRGLPEDEQEDVILLALTYGEAGAIDRFGPARGLPAAYSGHNSYADFREPSDPDATVVAIRYRPDRLGAHFVDCEQVATIDNGHDVDNEIQDQPITLCRGLRRPWPEIWDALRRFS
ncbi:MAG TPA: glycosyltransferase family 39 protein, partial [Acidimicrobiales bacterium]|nr:glycosyltransferase family 39 protein [Acidimicrobiales bacterium]